MPDHVHGWPATGRATNCVLPQASESTFVTSTALMLPLADKALSVAVGFEIWSGPVTNLQANDFYVQVQ